jgi:GT2 family glycosyltransferase
MTTCNKLVSIILLSYNSKDDLSECIPSIKAQTYENYEIILVDNASTDGSVDFIRKNYPTIKLVETGKNLGYPAGNNVGFGVAKGEYIVVVNPDIVADPKWLEELVKPFDEDPSISATTSKVLLYSQKDMINTCANTSHYTGLTFCRGLYKPADKFENYETVAAISGCSFAIRSSLLNSISGFDPDFFLYQEDADLSWRIRFAGGRIVYVPTSVIYHKFTFSIAPWKEFYLERNRYLILLKNLNSKTLILLSPSLIATELVTIGHALLSGPKHIKNKVSAYWWIIKNYEIVLKKRREILNNKKISDREFFELLDWRIPFEQAVPYQIISIIAEIIFNSFYRIYFKIVKEII